LCVRCDWTSLSLMLVRCSSSLCLFCFFVNRPAATEIYTLSLHDALPISRLASLCVPRATFSPEGTERARAQRAARGPANLLAAQDRKSTRLNSSHDQISYAVFCLKKKKNKKIKDTEPATQRSKISKA